MSDREELSLDAEDRIMIAVGKVGKKVDDLATATYASQLATAVAIAKIEQVEMNCPISQVQASVHAIKIDAAEAKAIALASKGESKRLAAIVSAAITSIGGTIMGIFGMTHRGGD
jgi:hypothetical protein